MKNLLMTCQAISALSPSSEHSSLSTEAMSFGTMENYFSKVSSATKSILSTLKNESDFKVVSLSLGEVTLNKDVTEAGYLAIRGVEVYKPSAFTGDVLKFVRMLEKQSSNVLLLNKCLEDFELTLSRMVHNPEDLTKPCTGLTPIKLPKGNLIIDDFSDFFMGRSGMDVTKLSNIYPSLTSINKVSHTLLDLTQKFNGNDVKDIRTRGDALYRTLGYLEEQLEEDGLQMTSKWRKVIGEQLLVITEWLGIYSLFVTKLVSVSVSHRDTISKLNTL